MGVKSENSRLKYYYSYLQCRKLFKGMFGISLYAVNLLKEVILVNDGSPDHFLQIAEEFVEKYPRRNSFD